MMGLTAPCTAVASALGMVEGATVGTALPVPPGQIGIYVSEAMVDLYGARLGESFAPLFKHFWPPGHAATEGIAPFFVAGVWRDYARQSGTIALDRRAYERISPDRRVNDLAFWLQEVINAVSGNLDRRGGTLVGKGIVDVSKFNRRIFG